MTAGSAKVLRTAMPRTRKTIQQTTDKMKELKIRFHHINTGYCQEFWEIFPGDKQKQSCFILRDTSGLGGSWRIASGEYYEPSFEVSDEVTLILCNHAWQE